MTKDVYFVSLGELVKSDITKSIYAFSDLLAKESSFPYFTTARVAGSFAIDYVYYKTIDSYKLGKIDTNEFKVRISEQLGIKNSPEIETAWNAMCELTEEAKEIIFEFFEHQATEHFKLCIVSSTNPLQYNYVVDQINIKLKADNLLSIIGNSRVVIKTSFEEHNLLLPELAKTAIVENNWDSTKYHIISYDSRLTEENLMLENAKFTYDESKAWMTFAGDYPQDF